MIEDDPFAPPPKRAAPFEALSIEELEARIETLKAEIMRCEQAIAAKRSHLAAASSVFGSKPS